MWIRSSEAGPQRSAFVRYRGRGGPQGVITLTAEFDIRLCMSGAQKISLKPRIIRKLNQKGFWLDVVLTLRCRLNTLVIDY